jgi:hypothetical protein
MQSLGFALRDEAWLTTLTSDVLKTSEIEGEHFKTLRSCLAVPLSMDNAFSACYHVIPN